MQLLHAWKDSLDIFRPKIFKLFLLVTLKSTTETYKFLFKYCWWLIGFITIISALTIFLAYFDILCPIFWFMPLTIFIRPVLIPFLYYMTLLAIRPSVHNKDWAYIRKYMWRFLYIMGWQIIGIFIFYRLPMYVVPFSLLYNALYGFISPLFVFFTLFMLDSDGSLYNVAKSWVLALKMFIYNMPFCLLIFIGRYIIFDYPFMNFVFGFAHTSISSIILLIISPFLINFIANFYIKKVHDQSELYFPTPK